jgi:hypothetical protein
MRGGGLLHFDLAQRVAPPLEPDGTQCVLGDRKTDAGQFVGQRIKCRQGVAIDLGRKATGYPAIFVDPLYTGVNRLPLCFAQGAGLI